MDVNEANRAQLLPCVRYWKKSEIYQLIKMPKRLWPQNSHVICYQTANKTRSLNTLIPALMEVGSVNKSPCPGSDK